MQTMVTADRVLDEVRRSVADALRLDPEKVRPESSLVTDLGAASLDFLDINYRIEQIFGVRMARHFVIEHAEELFGEGTVIDDHGRLTERGVSMLRRRYGSSGVLASTRAVDIDRVPDLITVQAVTDAVRDILETLPERCECGAQEWRSPDGAQVRCASCGEAARYEDGDQRLRTWLASSAGLGGGPG